MDRLWEKALSPFLRQATVDSPNKEHVVRNLVCSLGHYPHLIGIDVADVLGFFKGASNLQILYNEFSGREGIISLSKVRRSLFAHSPLYVHFEANHSPDADCPVFSMSDVKEILNAWISQDPSRDILFSLVLSPSPDRLLKLWQIFPAELNEPTNRGKAF